MSNSYFLFYLILLFLVACTDETDQPGPGGQPVITTDPTWLIPINQVLDGGVGKDGIPSIDNPDFTIASEVNYLEEEDLVLGIRVGDDIRAYPHPILDWHEIINDEIGDLSIALTYCPLTGTGIGWDRNINGTVTTFGVSGLLYNTNLMPYDRATNSTWSQQRLDCVTGENVGMKAKIHSFIETSWSTWKKAFPQSQILNTNTGFSRSYTRYPYGDYRTNHRNIIFPISIQDDRLPAKERVLGVRVNDSFKVYPFLQNESSFDIAEDNIEGQRLIIIRSDTYNFIVAFIHPDDGRNFSKSPIDDFPIVVEDDQGNSYNLLGQAEKGASLELSLPDQFMGYWFSWGTFYPDIEIH